MICLVKPHDAANHSRNSPSALLVTIPLATAIGAVLADRLLVYDGWTLLLIPWFLFVRDDIPATIYAVSIVLLYWWAMRVEVRSHVQRLRSGPNDWRSRFADVKKGYTGDPGVG